VACPLTGYVLATRFQWVIEHIEKVMVLVVLLSIAPALHAAPATPCARPGAPRRAAGLTPRPRGAG
jgi:hypothetical protein